MDDPAREAEAWSRFLRLTAVKLGLVGVVLGDEEVLLKELPGYADCRSKVRFRLIPGVW